MGWDVEGDVADRIEIGESLDLRGAVRLSALVPETSEFQIDGQLVETSYDPIYLEPGSYEVSLSDPLFDDYRRTVVVEAARATRVGADVEFRTGSVILDPMPVGANILVDGVAVGSVDAAGIILDALVIGEYTISIVSGRNREHLGSISVSEGDRIVLPVPTGTLTVTNVPESVVPIVDDAPLEIAQRDGGMVSSRPMLAGTYTVRLDDERYRPEEHEAAIVAGETTAVRLVAFAQIARRNRPDDWEPWTRESRSRPGRLPIVSWGLGLELFSDPTTGDTYGPGLPPLFVGLDFANGCYSEVSFGILQVRRDYDFEGDFSAYFRSVGEVEALYGLRYVFTWTNGYRFSDQSQTFDVIPALRLSMQTWELEFAVGDQLITWDVNNAGGVSPYTTTSAIGVGIGTAFRLHLGRLTLRLRFYADRNFLQDQLVREGDEVQPDGNQGFPTTALQTTPTGGFVFGGGIDLSIATGGRVYESPAGP